MDRRPRFSAGPPRNLPRQPRRGRRHPGGRLRTPARRGPDARRRAPVLRQGRPHRRPPHRRQPPRRRRPSLSAPRRPGPDLVGIHHAAGWTAVVIAHLDGPHPDLSPASSDPDQIWALLDKLTYSPAPPPYTAAAAATPSGAAGLQGWNQLLADPPGDLEPEVRNRLHELAELEAAWPGLAHSDRIVHGDLRADNMVRDHDRGVTFVDWAHATTGPACIDAVSLAPQLILAGHAPQDIARLLDEHPATATDPLASTAFLAALTGHWHRNARKPAPPGAPGLRAYQHRAATAGIALLSLRMN
ncbi:phosphotransferase family protein [Streptomyces sp. NPDC051658]|uniref:phosphotransferase family protein n=1 Tax=Streptomyces sp. NPDC051658 TaxID=3365667 RepID=UPI0037A5AA9B